MFALLVIAFNGFTLTSSDLFSRDKKIAEKATNNQLSGLSFGYNKKGGFSLAVDEVSISMKMDRYTDYAGYQNNSLQAVVDSENRLQSRSFRADINDLGSKIDNADRACQQCAQMSVVCCLALTVGCCCCKILS
jgi:hypothetical protein